MFIYECGSLTYLYKNNMFNIATEWRNRIDQFAKDNNIKTFNPATTYLNEQNHGYNPKFCVDQNRFYLDKADMVVAQIDYIEHSPGSIWELCYASEKKKIPIIGLGKTQFWSPHVMYGVNMMCSNVDEVIDLLSNMFCQSLK